MVLLTASTISAAISGVVICLFTFLLFLSGYILQQQTVRSLQEALSAPVEARVRLQAPIPFSRSRDGIVPETNSDANDTATNVLMTDVGRTDIPQVVLTELRPLPTEPSPQQLWHAHVDAGSQTDVATLDSPDTPSSDLLEDAWDGRFAYVLTLPDPSALCSAILFTKWQRQSSRLPRDQVNIVFLYPSDWEASSHQTYADALRLLIQAEHQHSVLLHPVPVSKIWTGIDVESQLLSELARNPWPYDRVLYLRAPGMLLDVDRLDSTLVSTYVDRSLLKSSWSRLRPPSRRGAPVNLHPDLLLFAQGKGLMLPAGDLQKTVTAKARMGHEIDTRGEAKDEYLARKAAYVVFDMQELDHARKEKITHNDALFERFEREREAICQGTDLLM